MDVRVTLLGGFSVQADHRTVPADAWSRRHAAGLVKLLALAHGHRLHREQMIAALWPDTTLNAAAPRLHKAAHFARRALGDQPGAVVLRQDLVMLLPDGHVTVDVEEFRSVAEAALAAGSAAQAEQALASYGGPLLPDDVYEPWTEQHRSSLEMLHTDLLRLAGRWERLLELQPADEEAHLALARLAADRGDARAALRQLERMDPALRRELGTPPRAEAETLRRELAAQ
ncbi:MAG: AfsR/SARP family transcriptional regulator, partial [Nocardioidaceae bacterium]